MRSHWDFWNVSSQQNEKMLLMLLDMYSHFLE